MFTRMMVEQGCVHRASESESHNKSKDQANVEIETARGCSFLRTSVAILAEAVGPSVTHRDGVKGVGVTYRRERTPEGLHSPVQRFLCL